MEELETVLKLFNQYGWRPILSITALLFVWTLSRSASGEKAPLLAVALARVYTDACRALATWWTDRQEDTDAKRLERQEDAAAKRELTKAQASRERALELAVLAANPGGSRAVDRAVYGTPCDVRTTGHGQSDPVRLRRLASEAPQAGPDGGCSAGAVDGRGSDPGPFTLAPPEPE